MNASDAYLGPVVEEQTPFHVNVFSHAYIQTTDNCTYIQLIVHSVLPLALLLYWVPVLYCELGLPRYIVCR